MQESRLALSLLCGTVFRRRYSRAKNGEARDLVFVPFNSCNGNLPGARSLTLSPPPPPPGTSCLLSVHAIHFTVDKEPKPN